VLIALPPLLMPLQQLVRKVACLLGVGAPSVAAQHHLPWRQLMAWLPASIVCVCVSVCASSHIHTAIQVICLVILAFVLRHTACSRQHKKDWTCNPYYAEVLL